MADTSELERVEEAAVTVVMTREEAKAGVAAVKRHQGKIFDIVLDMHDRRADVALDYPSWAVFVAREFDRSRSSAYRVLDLAHATAADALLRLDTAAVLDITAGV